jgi:hypothetical protein
LETSSKDISIGLSQRSSGNMAKNLNQNMGCSMDYSSHILCKVTTENILMFGIFVYVMLSCFR